MCRTLRTCIYFRLQHAAAAIVTLFVGCLQPSAMELMIGSAVVVTSVYSLRMSAMETMNVWTEVMSSTAAELMVDMYVN